MSLNMILEPKVKFKESSFWKIQPHVNWRFSEEVVIFCLHVRSLLWLFVKGAYRCILDSRDLFHSLFYLITVVIISVHLALAQPHFLFLRQMVSTRQPEFSGPAFEEELQQAVNALLVGLTTRLTNDICQNGTKGSGDQPPTIHTWLASYKLELDALNWWKAFKQAKGSETYVATLSWKDFHDIFFLQYFPRSEQQKYEREYHMIRQRDRETSGEFMKRFLRLAGFMGKKAGPPEEQVNHFKNIEILHERSSHNNKRNRDGDRIRPTTQDSNQRGYDQKGYDGQKRYPDYASSPPCDIYGKLHPGKACNRVTRACFTCGSTRHMARDFPKNGGKGGRGSGDDNKPTTKGQVFSSTKDQAANSSGTILGTLFLNGRNVLSYLIWVQHIL
ncbi:putative reverse transcriptase domain-containing protein [Tanacetum coccineum]